MRILCQPPVLTALLMLLALAPRVRTSAILVESFAFAAIALLAWQVALYSGLRRKQSDGADAATRWSGRSIQIALRPQHYVQAAVQLGVFAYWGYFWRPVYDFAALIAAQLAFAYAFDMLLTWSRRERYVLGFGPFPIVFSTNLFLWFRDDWFYLQFLMIAAAFLGKEFVRWQRDGRDTHIFNPSAFALGLFSVVLISTGTTDLTWGQPIASTLTLAPHIYTFLFLAGLVVMYFFSITLIAGFAAATLFAMSAVHGWLTGVPYFVDSDIPAAVFLGLHLLVTDPSTSPRSPLGKAIFGTLYGVGVFVLYTVLGAFGAPTFYDKLLCVPLLNLSVPAIDRFAVWLQTRSWHLPEPALARANTAHIAIWVVLFGAMTIIGKTDGRHTGDSLPFWIGACEQQRSSACETLLSLETTFCGDNSAWACNELGAHYASGSIAEHDEVRAARYFARGCELRFKASCSNLLDSGTVVHGNPHELDLRLLLREGGRNLMQMSVPDLYARACAHGWSFACNRGAPPR
jgi:hypothetical protein